MPRSATVAPLQHADLVQPICRNGPMPPRRPSNDQPGCAHEKGRVTVPAFSGSPYALANVTGSPRAQSARRTVRAYRGRGRGGQASKGWIGTSRW